ncbi:hypothetical protein BRYFOR_07297 [Marvinbryantia formatexigens DSM 14469]|uniref:Uncharacterized protein n=1 Tax=Marvinbryantia formatexigens DSM 14469 TaxID=478749 RepID=C6LF95_9FIRM|nr:hypothetical protein [Marvinbryantia formatexigens]EET60834.1 hypothetical protein BRYFOR_07297 [Marvinbryantia formatexigens DSM 14469]
MPRGEIRAAFFGEILQHGSLPETFQNIGEIPNSIEKQKFWEKFS